MTDPNEIAVCAEHRLPPELQAHADRMLEHAANRHPEWDEDQVADEATDLVRLLSLEGVPWARQAMGYVMRCALHQPAGSEVGDGAREILGQPA